MLLKWSAEPSSSMSSARHAAMFSPTVEYACLVNTVWVWTSQAMR